MDIIINGYGDFLGLLAASARSSLAARAFNLNARAPLDVLLDDDAYAENRLLCPYLAPLRRISGTSGTRDVSVSLSGSKKLAMGFDGLFVCKELLF